MYRTSLLMILLSPALAVPAETIYKSVDGQGNVTYSAQPLASAVKSEQVDVPAPPSEEAQRQAEEQGRKIKEKAKEMEKDRKAREAEQAAAAAAAAPQGGTTVVVPVPVPSMVDGPRLVPHHSRRSMPPDQWPGRPQPKR